MKAAVLHKFGSPLTIEELPTPQPKGEEILVRVEGVGVCHSDLHISDGRYPSLPLPLVLGHEIIGEAEGIGEVLVYARWGTLLLASQRSLNVDWAHAD
jgi:propanol-preferring alcohol dehydrogenase